MDTLTRTKRVTGQAAMCPAHETDDATITRGLKTEGKDDTDEDQTRFSLRPLWRGGSLPLGLLPTPSQGLRTQGSRDHSFGNRQLTAHENVTETTPTAQTPSTHLRP